MPVSDVRCRPHPFRLSSNAGLRECARLRRHGHLQSGAEAFESKKISFVLLRKNSTESHKFELFVSAVVIFGTSSHLGCNCETIGRDEDAYHEKLREPPADYDDSTKLPFGAITHLMPQTAPDSCTRVGITLFSISKPLEFVAV